jgi:hypothetical protein
LRGLASGRGRDRGRCRVFDVHPGFHLTTPQRLAPAPRPAQGRGPCAATARATSSYRASAFTVRRGRRLQSPSEYTQRRGRPPTASLELNRHQGPSSVICVKLAPSAAARALETFK